jgi:hypothetical protein
MARVPGRSTDHSGLPKEGGRSVKQGSFLSMAFAFLLCVCFPALLNAQTALGFRAGLNLATFGGGPIEASYDYREGVSIGAYLDWSIAERVGLQVGLGYAEKGAELEAETALGNLDWQIPIGYMEVPILFWLEMTRGGRVSPRILLGPTVSFKTSCKWETEVSGSPLKVSCDDPGFEVRAVDFGAMGGLSLKIMLSGGIALVGGPFYTFGLRPVGEGEDSVKNRAFSVTLGLAFPLG